MTSLHDIDPAERRVPPESYLVHRTVYLDRVVRDRLTLGDLRAYLAQLADWPDELRVHGSGHSTCLNQVWVTRVESIGGDGTA